MATNIHARETKDGLRFRIWSTINEAYLTEEKTEKEIRLYTLQAAVEEAIAEHQAGIDERITRTLTKGTSCMVSSKRKLNGPWEKENN